jgi:hypothetical protein
MSEVRTVFNREHVMPLVETEGCLSAPVPTDLFLAARYGYSVARVGAALFGDAVPSVWTC